MHVVLYRSYVFFFYSFLAMGDSYLTLAGRFRLGISTVAEIVKETCDNIWEELQYTYMKPPNNARLEEDTTEIQLYVAISQLPGCHRWQTC